MPKYMYKARDAAGKLLKGVMSAPSREDVVNNLIKMGYMPTQAAEVFIEGRTPIFSKFKRISTEDIMMFYIQLSNMMAAGLSLVEGLETLFRQAENEKLRKAIGELLRDVKAGHSFSEALKKQNPVFPDMFVNMVRSGEVSGKLEIVLNNFADLFENQEDLRQKVKGALFYPLILLAMGLTVIIFLVTFMIPQFVVIFENLGMSLPLPTFILYKSGELIKSFWYLIILSIFFSLRGVKSYAKTSAGRFNLDKMKLNLPLVGVLYRKVAIARFTRMLGTLLSSGVPILTALETTKEVLGNKVLARAIVDVSSAVKKGENIAGPLRMSGDFPADVVQMIAVGEESGRLDEMLNKVANFYDTTVDRALNKLTKVIEPVFLVIMGSVVGFIMASMLIPILNMVSVLRY